ncbi:MAG: FHA domain-containing protein [Deltaproteobacteria bacterium]|nr:FHA domain-containing protein [Deltaproteobacteria bacterium]
MINPALLDGVSANFIVKGPSGVEKSYPMRQLTMTIGRSDQCDIAVKDGSMSGRHCEVSKINGEIRVKDLGSANGIWLNGERMTDGELFDGDVIRCGQTSIRVDVVGGKKRPDAGMSKKLLIGLIAGFVVLAAGGIGLGIMLKKKAEKKRDLAAVASFVASAREGQKAKPCAAAVDKVADVAKQLNSIPKISCSSPPKGEEAKRIVGGYRELAKTYDRIVTATTQFAGQGAASTAATTGAADTIIDPNLKAKLAEATEAIEGRTAVTTAFIADWKKLAAATNAFATQAEAALIQGNKAACPPLEKGVQGKSALEILGSCNKGFEKAKNAVEDKAKELEDLTAGGSGAPAEAPAE